MVGPSGFTWEFGDITDIDRTTRSESAGVWSFHAYEWGSRNTLKKKEKKKIFGRIMGVDGLYSVITNPRYIVIIVCFTKDTYTMEKKRTSYLIIRRDGLKCPPPWALVVIIEITIPLSLSPTNADRPARH